MVVLLEDILQSKNDSVVGVSAPLMDDYPDGYVDSVKLPIALTWVMSTVIDPSATIGKNTVQIDVLVRPLGQGVFKSNKEICRDLRVLFMTEYLITAQNMWIQEITPVFRIRPGSIEFSGFREIILAPDETPYHGFTFTLEAEEYLDAVCP